MTKIFMAEHTPHSIFQKKHSSVHQNVTIGRHSSIRFLVVIIRIHVELPLIGYSSSNT